MADLLETSTFAAGITRIETSEPVIGGEDGVANRAPKLLASRTRWLKDQLDALAATLGSLYALRTGDYTTLRARATTKDDVGLGLVANYAPTNDASGGSTTKVATAAAVQAALASVVVAPTNLGVGGTGDNRTVTSSTGAAATLPLATSAAAGLMRAADKAKLDAVAPGAEANVGTNITTSVNTTQLGIYSSTGGDALVQRATETAAGIMAADDKIKLEGAAQRSGAVFSGQVRATIGSAAVPGLVFNLAGSGINGHSVSPSLFFSVGGTPAANLDAAGVAADSPLTIMTREKGDMRYAALSDAWPGIYTGSNGANVTFPVGATLLVADAHAVRSDLVTVRLSAAEAEQYSVAGGGALLTGVWRQRGALSGAGPSATLVERVA